MEAEREARAGAAFRQFKAKAIGGNETLRYPGGGVWRPGEVGHAARSSFTGRAIVSSVDRSSLSEA